MLWEMSREQAGMHRMRDKEAMRGSGMIEYLLFCFNQQKMTMHRMEKGKYYCKECGCKNG